MHNSRHNRDTRTRQVQSVTSPLRAPRQHPSFTFPLLLSLKRVYLSELTSNPAPTGSPLDIQCCGLSTDCSLKHRQVPHGSRSHGHDRGLVLCVNDPGQSNPPPSSIPPRDRTRTLVPTSPHFFPFLCSVSFGALKDTLQAPNEMYVYVMRI